MSREQVLDSPEPVTHIESRSLLTLVVVRRVVCPVNSPFLSLSIRSSELTHIYIYIPPQNCFVKMR